MHCTHHDHHRGHPAQVPQVDRDGRVSHAAVFDLPAFEGIAKFVQIQEEERHEGIITVTRQKRETGDSAT